MQTFGIWLSIHQMSSALKSQETQKTRASIKTPAKRWEKREKQRFEYVSVDENIHLNLSKPRIVS
jgi:hypothetical protein